MYLDPETHDFCHVVSVGSRYKAATSSMFPTELETSQVEADAEGASSGLKQVIAWMRHPILAKQMLIALQSTP